MHTLSGLISVWLWNFKEGGSEKARFLAKNQYTQRKPLNFENTGSTSSSKLGMILENNEVQKLELEKNVFYKKWSPK